MALEPISRFEGESQVSEGLTQREILVELRHDVKLIYEKLDKKADADRVNDLARLYTEQANRIVLIEAAMVKRDGPIISELKRFEKSVERMETLQKEREGLIDDYYKTRDRVDKIDRKLIALFAAIAAVGLKWLAEALGFHIPEIPRE